MLVPPGMRESVAMFVLHPFSSGSVVKTPFYALASLKLSFTQSASPPIFQNVVVPGQSLAAGKVPAHGCSELN